MQGEGQTITAQNALKGRSTPIQISATHYVNQTDMTMKVLPPLTKVYLGMGCFWGAERLLWGQPGVVSTAVGYAGGYTPNPTYEEVCSGQTGHAEVVQVIFDSSLTSLDALLTVFWENHDPTQGMRQGNDIGTQYRSVVLVESEAQLELTTRSQAHYQKALAQAGKPQDITTEVGLAGAFYYAEEYHQQYLAKNPNGYCGIGGTGVCFI